MARFFCEKCKYQFSPKDQSRLQPPKLCPYCGREGSVQLEETADDMVRNVDDMADR